MGKTTIKFIDVFAGIGRIRLGVATFEYSTKL